MYISHIDELIETLRPKLKEYLVAKIGKQAEKKTFKCFAHEENTSSMSYNPKDHNTTVRCFGCNRTFDIFSAAAFLDNLPANGPDWVTSTLPALAEMFDIKLTLRETNSTDQQRTQLFKLHNDVANILESSRTPVVEEYLKTRGWSDDHLTIGSIDKNDLSNQLIHLGWDVANFYSTLGFTTGLFGEDKITFVIRDYRKRPVGFISRSLSDGPKYINSPESLIYEKRKHLLGIETALPNSKQGIYVVEGSGEVAALHRVGILNVVAACGTALTSEHLSLLKMLGVTQLTLALDWDSAGQEATKRILRDEIKLVTGVSCSILEAPDTKVKDISEFLEDKTTAEEFLALTKLPAFEWLLNKSSNTASELCVEMLPIIASEPTAIRREVLVKILSTHTGTSVNAILEDIRELRDGKAKERNRRIEAAAEKYLAEVVNDPSNAQAALSQHQEYLEHIDKEFNQSSLGPDYQLARYDVLEQQKEHQGATNFNEFRMTCYQAFANAMMGSMPWTDGALIYAGGRQNSGKTATCIALAMDVVLSDPDAVVLLHFTDDAYCQVEPRIKTNLARMLNNQMLPSLTIGMAANPKVNITTQSDRKAYDRASSVLRELLASGRLTIIDSADGTTLTALERHIRDVRHRFPDKKLLVMCDNTHNYTDFGNLDDTARAKRISTMQKAFTTTYHCCMLATVEYRKNSFWDITKMKEPVDDDIADSRAMMYRPNAIVHVYNDLNDRREHASIFWTKEDEPDVKLPRLVMIFGKNKLSSFKDKLAFNLDPVTVTIQQEDITKARKESRDYEVHRQEQLENPDYSTEIPGWDNEQY